SIVPHREAPGCSAVASHSHFQQTPIQYFAYFFSCVRNPSNFPDKLVESSGGFFYSLFSKIPRSFPDNKLSVPLLNINIPAPWGLSSGWADSYEKLIQIRKIGAGIVISKTITINPLKGNPYPRIVRDKKNKWLINSMGLPNQGLKKWLSWLSSYENLPNGIFLSIKGHSIKEWDLLIKKLSPFTSLLELNLSCPNVKDGIMDMDKTVILINRIAKKFPKVNFSIKISSEYHINQILRLLDNIHGVKNNIKGLSLFNTYPVVHNRLGIKNKQGGLSGPILFPKLTRFLKEIRQEYNFNKLLLFATGGIENGEQAINIWQNYQAFPLCLTAFLTQGPFIFNNWAKVFSNRKI
ncbi:MAG: dihydroorotate dehydrogenase, partial [Candidatus Thorarchaeota archaeon]